MALVNHATLADCVVVRRGAWVMSGLPRDA